MAKIPSVKEMEDFLLHDSKTSDLVAAGDTNAKSPDTKLTARQVQHEVSVFSRVLINVYCGWPFHDEILKRRVLQILTDIYKNAHDMTSLELLEQLKQVIKIIPDNHINLNMVGYHKEVRTGLRKQRPNVGSNVAGDEKFIIDLKNDIGIIGIRTLSKWSAEERESFDKQWRAILPKSKSLIVDIRDNGGGSSRPVESLARYILGHRYPAARKEIIRNNPDANAVKKLYKNSDIDKFNVDSADDPVVYSDHSTDILPKFDPEKAGFTGPVYILTNGRVMSSGEIFCTNMRYYPHVKFIGTNTRGGEVYGYNYAYILLPHSHMTFNVGCVYRDMFVENFELNGYKPDIECEDGTDAMDVAFAQIGRKNFMIHQKGLEK